MPILRDTQGFDLESCGHQFPILALDHHSPSASSEAKLLAVTRPEHNDRRRRLTPSRD